MRTKRRISRRAKPSSFAAKRQQGLFQQNEEVAESEE